MKGGGLHAAALTATGAATAARAAKALGATLHLPSRLAGGYPGALPYDDGIADLLARLMPEAEGIILVMAAGIVMRAAAPHLTDKYHDPAIVVLDPEGRFAVPLLSGHLGGANRLAGELYRRIGAQVVITTATDSAGAPAMEVWAIENGLGLANPREVARINRALAEGEGISLQLDPLLARPPGLDELTPFLKETGPKVAVALYPVEGALTLIPRAVALGMGARKNAGVSGAVEGVAKVLENARLHPLAIAAVATIDIKKEEAALVEVAKTLGAPLVTYDAKALAPVAVPNPSPRVREATGTPAVAEAAALLCAGSSTLLIEKTAGADWTLAAAIKKEWQR